MPWGRRLWQGRASIAPRSWSLFGIPIQLAPSWFAVVVFVAWSLGHGYFPSRYPGMPPALSWGLGAAAAVLLFGCVVLHELGHSLVALGHGIRVACVTLFMFGGVAQIASNPRRPADELKIALAGPAVSALIAWTCTAWADAWQVETLPGLVGYALVRYLASINLALLLFNLLPGYPLDGGRVLRAAIWAVRGDVKAATRIAGTVGAALGLGLFGLGLWAMSSGVWIGGIWYVLVGLFLYDAARASVQRGW